MHGKGELALERYRPDGVLSDLIFPICSTIGSGCSTFKGLCTCLQEDLKASIAGVHATPGSI